MSKKREAFLPMFCGDFFSATAEWEGEEEALYALLLMRQWSLGHLPTEVQKLARLVKYDHRTFERWWPTVSSKFEVVEVPEKGPRLINRRLEEHREKSVLLSRKNSISGTLGAEAKKRKVSERHPSGEANATGTGSERHKSAEAPIAKQSIPSHPIPSGVLPPSPQAPNVCTPIPDSGAGSARANGEGNGESEGSPPKRTGQQTADAWSDAAQHADWLTVHALYPPAPARADWIGAEKFARQLVLDGEATWPHLRDAVTRYAALCKATNRIVMNPAKFFTERDKPWAQPWPLPPKSSGTNASHSPLSLEELKRKYPCPELDDVGS